MLFNSAAFIFLYLPVVLAGFFLLGSLAHRQFAIAFLFAASVVFYGWDDPWRLIPIVLASAAFNFIVGRSLLANKSLLLLAFGIAGNLAALGYFKYADFLLGIAGFKPIGVLLPIGISFYTFTQIAFLVDAYRREATEYDPLKYGLFVTFFPHLVAGPIIHHKEVMPQFGESRIYQPDLAGITLGLAWFTIGLFKKVVFADNVAAFVAQPFDIAARGAPVGFSDAWIGVLAYTLQIYFDFSGYSDMAIGLALMFGITFPLNFNSPYKARSIIDFWRRWHMTLSRFLRDYLYIPLGGSRRGVARRYLNIIATMTLGGLWHGASWNFVIWGALHGAALTINHAWRAAGLHLPAALAWPITMLVVVFAWVPFRAADLPASLGMWRAMIGLNERWLVSNSEALWWIAALGFIALACPNTQQLLSQRDPRQLKIGWALALGGLFGLALSGVITRPSEFLYFRF